MQNAECKIIGATPIIDKVVVMRSLIIPFCVAKREGDRTAGVVVGSSLSVFLQFDRSDSLALLRKEEGGPPSGGGRSYHPIFAKQKKGGEPPCVKMFFGFAFKRA